VALGQHRPVGPITTNQETLTGQASIFSLSGKKKFKKETPRRAPQLCGHLTGESKTGRGEKAAVHTQVPALGRERSAHVFREKSQGGKRKLAEIAIHKKNCRPGRGTRKNHTRPATEKIPSKSGNGYSEGRKKLQTRRGRQKKKNGALLNRPGLSYTKTNATQKRNQKSYGQCQTKGEKRRETSTRNTLGSG